MRLLVLGGTRFLGRHLVTAALAAGHDVTLFNRGHTSPELFPAARRLVGDRDDPAALGTGEWDGVLDFSGYLPRQVRASARLLADRAGHYTYLSSTVVYRQTAVPGLDEDAPLLAVPDGLPEAVDDDTYGPFKVACEGEVAAAFDGRSTSVRTGAIAGEGDEHDITPWIAAVAAGGEVSCAARAEQPIQFLDGRDLADFLLTVTTAPKPGVFTAVGPGEALTFAALLERACEVAGSRATVRWGSDGDGYVVLPRDGSQNGTYQLSNARARAAGLRFRPMEDTLRATLEWVRSR